MLTFRLHLQMMLMLPGAWGGVGNVNVTRWLESSMKRSLCTAALGSGAGKTTFARTCAGKQRRCLSRTLLEMLGTWQEKTARQIVVALWRGVNLNWLKHKSLFGTPKIRINKPKRLIGWLSLSYDN